MVVDTSKIIYDLRQLYRTKLVACWFETEQDYHLVSTAPKNSFLWKIFKEKRFRTNLTYPDGSKTDLCLMNNAIDAERIHLHMQHGFPYAYFIMMSKTILLLLFCYISNNLQGTLVFKNEENYYELVLGMLMLSQYCCHQWHQIDFSI